MNERVRGRLLAGATFVLLAAAYHLVFVRYFPTPQATVGHDFSISLTILLDGYLWFRTNGLFAVPWFTPSICGGVPFFGDPQSSYYSVPSFLAFVTDPLAATYLTLIVFAALGFWGFYLLMRRRFAADWQTATLTGALFMYNGFHSYRTVIGESYHGFMLLPWIALLLLDPHPILILRGRLAANSILAGALIAYWLHSGLTTLMIPAGLSVAVVCALHGLRGNSPRLFLARSCSAIVVALALCAAKLTSSLSFFGFFPRSDYQLPGLDSVVQSLRSVLSSLFLPSEWVATDALPHLRNQKWAVFPHEWAYGLTIVPLVMFTLAALLRLPVAAEARPRRWLPRGGWPAALHLAVLLLILSLPVALMTYSPGWNALLKRTPIIKTTSYPFRWIIVYLPFIAISTGLAFHWCRVRLGRRGWWLLPAALAGIVLQTAVEPNGWYTRGQDYDARPLLAADARYRGDSRLRPEIQAMGFVFDQRGNVIRPPHALSNNAFLSGMSQILCYDPVFGYQLEHFPFKSIHPGPALSASGGVLNVKNPACFIFPAENGCTPGDHFRVDQIEEARLFLSYRPFDFAMPLRQKVAGWISEAALVLVTLVVLAAAGTALRRWLTALVNHRPRRRQAAPLASGADTRARSGDTP